MNKYYKMTWGETLDSIANKFDTDVETLQAINHTTEFHVGNLIRVSHYRYYYTSDTKMIKKSLTYCLARHKDKKRYYRIV